METISVEQLPSFCFRLVLFSLLFSLVFSSYAGTWLGCFEFALVSMGGSLLPPQKRHHYFLSDKLLLDAVGAGVVVAPIAAVHIAPVVQVVAPVR